MGAVGEAQSQWGVLDVEIVDTIRDFGWSRWHHIDVFLLLTP